MQSEAKSIVSEIIGKSSGGNRSLEVADKTGICLSLACAVHCLALPVFITLLPMIGLGFLLSGVFETILGISAILLGFVCVFRGWKSHGENLLWFPFALASFFILSGLFMAPHGLWEIGLIVTGGMFLVATHLLNRWFCRAKPVCSCVAHDSMVAERKAA